MVEGPICLAVELTTTLFSQLLNFFLSFIGAEVPGIVQGALDIFGCG